MLPDLYITDAGPVDLYLTTLYDYIDAVTTGLVVLVRRFGYFDYLMVMWTCAGRPAVVSIFFPGLRRG